MKVELNITFTKEEVEAIRKYGCAGVECVGFSCTLCPFNDMKKVEEKYQYALGHMEEGEQEQ